MENDRCDSPATKAISEEPQIIAHPACFVNPTLGIELLWFRKDIGVICNSPEITNVTAQVERKNAY
jgi:hypothetical protein